MKGFDEKDFIYEGTNTKVFPRGCDGAKMVTVIETKAARGAGTNEQPIRIVTQYWTLDGKFLAEFDPSSTVILEDG